MGFLSEIKDLWGAIKENKVLKYLFIVAAFVAVLWFTKYTYNFWIDKPIGSEYEDKNQVDSIKPTVSNPIKHDTVFVKSNRDNTARNRKSNQRTKPVPAIEQNNNSGDNNAVGRDNNGIQGNDNKNNHIINGNNYGTNGDVNYTGIEPRSISDVEVIRNIASKIPSHSCLIGFAINGGKDAINYALKIRAELFKLGYKRLDPNLGSNIELPTNNENYRVQVASDTAVLIFIYPAPNVK